MDSSSVGRGDSIIPECPYFDLELRQHLTGDYGPADRLRWQSADKKANENPYCSYPLVYENCLMSLPRVFTCLALARENKDGVI